MERGTLFFIFVVSFLASISAQDPLITDGDKYKAILENDRVRVLEYTDTPGDKTRKHHHPDFVLYALDPFKRRLTMADGKRIEREFRKGDVMWMHDQIHIGENIGSTNTHVLIVELKPCHIDIKDTATTVPYDEKWKENQQPRP
jgi:beta-alanine degradation protein BauB